MNERREAEREPESDVLLKVGAQVVAIQPVQHFKRLSTRAHDTEGNVAPVRRQQLGQSFCKYNAIRSLKENGSGQKLIHSRKNSEAIMDYEHADEEVFCDVRIQRCQLIHLASLFQKKKKKKKNSVNLFERNR
jgi:hypothetical protein